MKVWKACGAIALGWCFGNAALAADATTDFSITNGNPNGAWAYGSTVTLGGTFTAFQYGSTQSAPSPQSGSLNAWSNGAVFADVPWVALAGASGWTCCNSVSVAADTLTMHPGASGEFAVVSYTAAATGLYSINASFFGQDYGGTAGGTTTDVHVLAGNSSLFSANVVGFGNTQTFSNVVSLLAGQNLYFVVGVGAGLGNGNNYFNDSTGLTASVTAVPEPEGLALALAGLAVAGAAGAAGKRRRPPAD